ncbi:uracil-DNA glycosylase family protein [Loktanella sp. D2R18]|nr:uracil-DNA glycosylase family protein [Loktanella sp. D2R18]MDO6588646.1 uracil-DNA glycosylase family protein [Yoonia sp. 1_MG-2023]RBW42383.1 uracil-DNA glycosylase family protein [Loktanella sp. D2R18]
MGLRHDILSCELCADRFAQTQTAHHPRPVVWFDAAPRILIAGQAPGLRVHEAGKPFWDRSGDRLRDWLGLDHDAFYDVAKIAIVPMAFCFPGYNAAGSDLPPPKTCADTWHKKVVAHLGEVPLTLVIGGHAQRWHLQSRGSVTDTVASWRDYAPRVFPLPHPSWRNTGWLKKNQWFETDLLPALRAQVKDVLND